MQWMATEYGVQMQWVELKLNLNVTNLKQCWTTSHYQTQNKVTEHELSAIKLRSILTYAMQTERLKAIKN